MKSEGFDASVVLRGLKDFQRRTVDHVFDRLYGGHGTRRFLVADEVGLGKTMVAKGLIARVLEHLQGRDRRLDIIYICSNAAIAAQNISRLNITGQKSATLASRLTLLPRELGRLQKNQVNFVSFTPGTTFDLKSRGGQADERALIYQMLKGTEWASGTGLLNLLQASKGRERWRELAARPLGSVDPGLTSAFQRAVLGDEALSAELAEGCRQFARGSGDSNLRYRLIGELRLRLAQTCLGALEPDLVILDEFQRFKSLLDGKNDHGDQDNVEAFRLAQALFDHPRARTLLLSATPYKMLALDHERDEDHHAGFMRTLGFLLDQDPQALAAAKEGLERYRRRLFALTGGDTRELAAARDGLQQCLLGVMCRTERVGRTERLDAMLNDCVRPAPIEAADLQHARAVAHVARAVGVGDQLEYWKSSPYVLNFLKPYALGRRLDDHAADPPAELLEALAAAEGSLLEQRPIERYEDIPAGNPRMRNLFDDTLGADLGRLLWMPPSLPYTTPEGRYATVGPVTKALVFSAWKLVPDAIAVLTSFEAERRAVLGLERRIQRSELGERVKPLLQFSQSRDRLTGMPVLAWMAPFPALTRAVDPLALAVAATRRREPLTRAHLVAQAEVAIGPLLRKLPPGQPGPRPDERWYWAAPILLESTPGRSAMLKSSAKWGIADDEGSSRFRDHIGLMEEAGRGEVVLGPRPDDLPRVLAELALAGPGCCALRALTRIAGSVDEQALLSAAGRVANGFRTLFNVPESIALLRGEGHESYWRLALDYGLEGNLQALLDEQCHLLVEQLGVTDQEGHERVQKVADHLAASLSIRTTQIHVHEISAQGGRLHASGFNARCRFGLRFGDFEDERGAVERADLVRTAFNSPFRPFVLASTSIGQEGLDFHTWCHAVVHWNLPSNPVDLEQREGRVHRYKGHAVRKNIAEHYGLVGLTNWNGRGDPWHHLFEQAKEDRGEGASDLVPYWIFEKGQARIERRVPLLPFSREEDQLKRLKRSLALYRLVFGQPRQEDLLAHLAEGLDASEAETLMKRWRINLEPPQSLLRMT
jgi:hypothetical protein